MTDSFFGFNNSITGFEEGLHDDPGQGLDEEAEEYDALNDETFGADSLDGDWEQDHEKLAQITEQSRTGYHDDGGSEAGRDGYHDDGGQGAGRDEEYYEEGGFEDLDLEASLSQLVTDDDELLVENKKPKTHRSVNRMGAGVLEGGYSCSPPSQVNVWGVQRQDQQHALKPQNNLQPTKKYCTVEELERTLKQSSGMLNQKKVTSAVRLEDLERDLTSSKHKVPPGFSRPIYAHGQQEQARNGVPPGFGQHQHRNMGMRAPYNPQPQIMLPPGMDFRHRPMGMGPGPNMFRFLPPHLMMAAQQHFQPRPNFRPPYQQPPQMARGVQLARGMPPLRYPGPRPPRENGDSRDDYDGLMTEREVQWLLNIQQININTARPYVDDFYFTVFTARHPKQPHGDRRRTRERRDSHRDSRPEQPPPGRVYTPLQFENSLGKLQCGSVTAPRKIIDMDVVSNEPVDPSVAQTSQRDTRKAKQLLLTIEQLYLVLLKLEDLECPLARATPPAVGEAAGTEPPADRPSLVARLTSALSVEDRLQAAMCVRKGKDLVVRLLPHLSPVDDADWLSALWCSLFKGLIPVGRRDSEPGTLMRFYPHLKGWLQSVDLEGLVRAVTALRTTPPARNTLAYALGNKFGVCVCCALVSRALELPPAAQSPEWRGFLQGLSEAASLGGTTRPLPVDRVDASALGDHLDRSGVERSALLIAILSGTSDS